LKPGFALTAILSLALGIGANTAIFTLVDQVLLRSLPVHNPKELVQLRVEGGRFGSNTGDDEHTFSYPIYVAFRDRNMVFSGLTGERVERASLTSDERAEMISVGMVAGNYFDVLGVPPHLGRVLGPGDNMSRNGHPVAVLQYDFWQNRFAADPNVRLRFVQRFPFTIIGERRILKARLWAVRRRCGSRDDEARRHANVDALMTSAIRVLPLGNSSRASRPARRRPRCACSTGSSRRK
jgi:hypothetical protein